jgi:biotin synthase-like enzyme
MKYIDIGVTHTDRVRVSPVQGCSFTCLFCDIPYTLKYMLKDVGDIIETIRVAQKDEALPAKHVLISGGTPFPKDEGYLDDVFKRVAEAVSLPVDVMMVPRKDLGHIDKLYSWGINTLYYNIEAYDSPALKSVAAKKAQVGREHYMKSISRAVDVFGKGKVQSLIIVGLESPEHTLQGVEQLCELGCIPILSPFRPSESTPLRDKRPPSADELMEVYERGREIASHHGLRLGPRCIPCHHNTLTFPDKSDFYFYS